jgi:hypothetical protein
MSMKTGVEYYFGSALPENDLTLENLRSREKSWDYGGIALGFFRDEKIRFWDMTNADCWSAVDRGTARPFKRGSVASVKAGRKATVGVPPGTPDEDRLVVVRRWVRIDGEVTRAAPRQQDVSEVHYAIEVVHFPDRRAGRSTPSGAIRRVICCEITQCVLDAGQQVLQHLGIRKDVGTVPEAAVEHPTFTVPPDPAHREVHVLFSGRQDAARRA